MKIERTVKIAASPEQLYEVVMDPGRLEEWVTIHQRLEDAPNGPLRKGSKLTQCLKVAGKKFKVRWTVVENEPCTRVVWEGRGPVGSHAHIEYGFAAGDGHTEFSYLNSYELPGGWLGRFAGRTVARVTEKELEGSLQRLKSLVE